MQEDKGPQSGSRLHGAAHVAYRADLMRQIHDGRLEEKPASSRCRMTGVERCMRYVKAVEKQSGRLRKPKGPQRDHGPVQGTAGFEALLLERWKAWQEAKKQGGHAEIQRVGN